MKSIIIFCLILLSNCSNRIINEFNPEKTTTIPEGIKDSPKEIIKDSVFFNKKLTLNSIYKQIKLDSLYNQNKFDNYKISLPFQYSIKYPGMGFDFIIGDLLIDPKSSNCSVYRLDSHIPYHGNNHSEGNLYLVKTNDSTAITTNKYLDLNKTAYKKIYYYDNESIIFKNPRNNISVLQYKYLKDKKVFAVYYRINENFFAKSSEEDILDLSITRLRMAKNLFRKKRVISQPNWSIYKNALSTLEIKKTKESFEELKPSIDTLFLDSTLKSKGSAFSLINMGNQAEELWKILGTLSKDKFTDFNTLNTPRITRSIYFLRGSNNFLKTDFKDSNSFILKRKERSGFGNSNYAILKKVKIKGNSFLFYTNFSIASKEMAYYNLSLINNYNDI